MYTTAWRAHLAKLGKDHQWYAPYGGFCLHSETTRKIKSTTWNVTKMMSQQQDNAPATDTTTLTTWNITKMMSQQQDNAPATDSTTLTKKSTQWNPLP